MIPDRDYCLTCQKRPGAKEPPFNYPICRVCRARMMKPVAINWWSVMAMTLIVLAAMCWFAWPT